MSIEDRIRAVMHRAEREVLLSDAAFQHLYNPEVRTRPLFFFGRAATASYFTIGANPSADDFRRGNWRANDDLADQALSYFHDERIAPHVYFRNWVAALAPLGLTYHDNLAHLDVSPRATKSLQVINQLGARTIGDFLSMARADAAYLFALLEIRWSELRGLFAAGSITKARYLDAFLREVGPRYGFSFRRKRVFAGKSKGPGSCSKLYEVTFRGCAVPLFFCHVGPSSHRPGDQEYFQQQVIDHQEFLRSLFLPPD